MLGSSGRGWVGTRSSNGHLPEHAPSQVPFPSPRGTPELRASTARGGARCLPLRTGPALSVRGQKLP